MLEDRFEILRSSVQTLRNLLNFDVLPQEEETQKVWETLPNSSRPTDLRSFEVKGVIIVMLNEFWSPSPKDSNALRNKTKQKKSVLPNG